MEFIEGQLRDPSLADCKIPGIRDLPRRFEAVPIESVQTSRPYGAKGVGESGTFGVSPAIASAVGVRITELPITAEAVYRALRQAAWEPLMDD